LSELATLNQIAEHSYWLPPDDRTDRPILGVLAGEKGCALIDAGTSSRHVGLALAEIDRLNLGPVLALVATHWHWDHVFGAAGVEAPFIVHQMTAKKLHWMAGLSWDDEALNARIAEGLEIEFCRDMIQLEFPERSEIVVRTADIIFSDKLDLDLGGVTCSLLHAGGDHAADSCVAYCPEDRVLFLGDSTYPNLHAGPRHYMPQTWLALAEQLLEFKAEHLLLAHDNEPYTGDGFHAQIELTSQIAGIVQSTGADPGEVRRSLEQHFGTDNDLARWGTAQLFIEGQTRT
jgi:glyoxylase-like metal-dependent hydrolase (beta-lactamase superfamily II)